MSKFLIKTINGISKSGLKHFSDKYKINSDTPEADAILVRSASMHDMEFPAGLKSIARAGAGVNNIPIERCSEEGIVVFNTPGANANAVKELTIAALFLSSRNIIAGVNWSRALKNEGVEKQVEAGKSQFAGPELENKKLGVIGLGAIGVMVANAAAGLGMEVYGYDPYISVDAAWGLSTRVKKATSLKEIFSQSDYITLHIPLTEKTRHTIDSDALEMMKQGVRVINMSRGALIDDDAMIAALESEKVNRYVTDFPNEKLLKIPQVIPVPHLGASTPESEENCAVMAVMETKDFLENGNIKNSVNFPECNMGVCNTRIRVTVAHRNIPKMLGQISSILAEEGLNIENMLNKSRNEYAYTMLDIDSVVSDATLNKLREIEGVLKVRPIAG